MHPKHAPLAAVILVLALAAASPLTVLAQDAESSSKPAKKTPHERIWWNQTEKIQVLALTAEQRGKMDAALTAFFDNAPRPNDRQQNMEVFTAALAKGDWEAADKAVEVMADAAARPIHVTANMMIEVVQLLTPYQLRTLNARYPELLKRPWVRLRGMARSRGAGAAQSGGPR